MKPWLLAVVLSGCGFSFVAATRTEVREGRGCMSPAYPTADAGFATALGILAAKGLSYEEDPTGPGGFEALVNVGGLLLAMPAAMLLASSVYGVAKVAGC